MRKGNSSLSQKDNDNYKMLSRMFFRLLPYQVLMIVISAVNGIVDGLFASNAVGTSAMSAMGLYAPLTHFLYALSIMLVSGSQLLYGKYVIKDHERIHSVFTLDLLISLIVSLILSAAMIIGAVTNIAGGSLSDPTALSMFNRYLIGNAFGIPGGMRQSPHSNP